MAGTKIPASARRLKEVRLRPGVSLYLQPYAYVDALHHERHKLLRMWDMGPHLLVQSLDDSGEVVDEIELLWHATWYRRVL